MDIERDGTRSEIEYIEEDLRQWADSLSHTIKDEKEIVAQYSLSERDYYRERYDSANTIQSKGECKGSGGRVVAFDREKTRYFEWIYLVLEDDTYYDYEEKHRIAATHAELYLKEAVKYIAVGQFSLALGYLRMSDSALDMAHKFKHSIMPYEKAESIKGMMANQVRLEKDPKQKAKEFVYSSWQVWQEEPERYKSKAAFARDILKQEQCKSLKSQKKIEDWCREWEKSLPAG